MTKKELRDINRKEEDVLRGGIEWLAISMLGAAAVGILLMAGKASAETAEAQAAQVIQKNCTVRAETLYVPPVPTEAPTEGEPPVAIDVTPTEAETEPVEEWESLGTWKLSFYCPCRKCSGKWGHRTSSGATCEEGVTVACAVLPAGTVVKIDGYGERIVQDTGAGVRGNHLDVFMESHSECLEHGIQYREVWIKK